LFTGSLLAGNGFSLGLEVDQLAEMSCCLHNQASIGQALSAKSDQTKPETSWQFR
jgi:hypothetical protein